MSSTKASSVRSKLLLWSGNLSRLTLSWVSVTVDRSLRANSTPSSQSLMYKKGKKTSSSLIMWHRYAKRTIWWLCYSSSRCKEVRGQLQRDGRRTLGTMCTCEKIERGTHACRASNLGPVKQWWTQDGKLGITIQEPPTESGRQTHLLHFTYLYCILSRVWKHATSLLVLRHYEHLFLFSISLLQVTSSRFCLYLLNIFYQFTYTFSHAHTEAHTHKHTCTISTQEECRQPGTGAWLRGVEERPLLETKTLHTKIKK